MAWEDFLVVRNDEEQYSIWPAGQRRPPGWHAVGVSGDQGTCLADLVPVLRNPLWTKVAG